MKRNEIAALDSDTGAGEVYYLMTDTLGIQVNGSWSREERVERKDLSQYSASAGLFVRF